MKPTRRNHSFSDLTRNEEYLNGELKPSLKFLRDINGYNPYLVTEDTEWIDNLYKEIYPMSPSRKHKATFRSIIVNLALRKDAITISLSRENYQDISLPKEIAPSAITGICEDLHKKGYLSVVKGFKVKASIAVPTELRPFKKLLDRIPVGFRTEIAEEGLIQIKGFTPGEIPEHVENTRQVLKRYNRTVESENHLFASFKDGFDVNGRFHGSTVCTMRKEDRKDIMIDGEKTIEIDIRNCIPSLLSASELGKLLPGDVYAIDGIPRAIVKKAMLCALNCESRRQAQNALQKYLNADVDTTLKASEVLDALEDSAGELSDFFYTARGTRLMRIESSCMEKFMVSMLDKGIKVYPIYDSVRVPISKSGIVEEELKKAFTINGVEPVVHVE